MQEAQKYREGKRPEKQDRQPGSEKEMNPRPEFIRDTYRGSGRLKGKRALITGGDSGIGRSVSVHFAREGADVAIVYLEEDADALETRDWVEKAGRQCLLFQGDIQEPAFCRQVVREVLEAWGRVHILVNNAGIQIPEEEVEAISPEQLDRVFRTNIFSFFYFTEAVVPQMKAGDSIINTTSVTAYRSSPTLIDYSSTKGAITSFTRSLATHLAEEGIRVNAVAPGPVWTPLIVSSFDEQRIKDFGSQTAMKRAGQPSELGPAYVFLASEEASFITGQVIHVNGGEVVNG